MSFTLKFPANRLLVGLSGFLATILLVFIFDKFGLCAGEYSISRSYSLSDVIGGCVGLQSSQLKWSFIFVYFSMTFTLAILFRRVGSLALGLVMPLPMAVIIEGALDSTSHNLLGLEILFFWLPTVIATLAVAWLGEKCSRAALLHGGK